MSTNISFAKTPGAGTSAPVTPAVEKAPDANAVVDPSQLPVTQDNAPAPTGNSLGFYTGDDDAPDQDPRDVRLPRLNLVQGMSGEALKAIAKEGNFVLKQALDLGTSFRAVVVGFRPKVFIEKMTKYGEGEARIARTIQEVAALGGTEEWKHSRENKDKEGTPVSKKPWFPAHVTGLLLIEKPEGFDDAHFSAVTPSGKAFCAALITVKSTSYGSFFIPLNSERTGLFRGTFASRYIEVKVKKDKAYVPVPTIKEETDAEVRALAVKALS